VKLRQTDQFQRTELDLRLSANKYFTDFIVYVLDKPKISPLKRQICSLTFYPFWYIMTEELL